MLSVQISMTSFVIKFLFAGLQCYQISGELEVINCCLKWPILLNKYLISIWLLCSAAKKLTRHGFTKGHQTGSMANGLNI